MGGQMGLGGWMWGSDEARWEECEGGRRRDGD